MLRCNGPASKWDAAMQRPGLQGALQCLSPASEGWEKSGFLGPASEGEAPTPRPRLQGWSAIASTPPGPGSA